MYAKSPVLYWYVNWFSLTFHQVEIQKNKANKNKSCYSASSESIVHEKDSVQVMKCVYLRMNIAVLDPDLNSTNLKRLAVFHYKTSI